MVKDILIVGGSSGLGLELAERYADLGHRVVVAGRKDPKSPKLKFLPFDVGADEHELITKTETLLAKTPSVNTLIYVAGYYQEGRIDTLKEDEILSMVNIGLVAPALLVRRLKNNHGKPLKIILITSTSQFTPRELEPMYTAVKSGLGMLGNSLGQDVEIGKVLIVAPAGMKTPFWKDGRDVSKYLEPSWVAEKSSSSRAALLSIALQKYFGNLLGSKLWKPDLRKSCPII